MKKAIKALNPERVQKDGENEYFIKATQYFEYNRHGNMELVREEEIRETLSNYLDMDKVQIWEHEKGFLTIKLNN